MKDLQTTDTQQGKKGRNASAAPRRNNRWLWLASVVISAMVILGCGKKSETKLDDNVPEENHLELAELMDKAEAGDAQAQCVLAWRYEWGEEGLDQDYEEAARWYRKSAEQGFDHAQYHLGILYSTGDGLNLSYEEAARWYRKAAEQGNISAQCALAWCYEHGEGVPQSIDEAAKWYRKAAEQGDEEAKDALERLGR